MGLRWNGYWIGSLNLNAVTLTEPTASFNLAMDGTGRIRSIRKACLVGVVYDSFLTEMHQTCIILAGPSLLKR